MPIFNFGIYQKLAENAARKKKKYFALGNNSTTEAVSFLNRTKESIKIVTGELNPAFFEAPEILLEINDVLSRKCKIDVVFNKRDTEDEALKAIYEENPGLVELIKKYPDKINLIWVSLRPCQHYVISDNKHLYIEGKHEPYEDHESTFIYSSPQSAARWTNLFNALIDKKKH